jgi:hypothetical protein
MSAARTPGIKWTNFSGGERRCYGHNIRLTPPNMARTSLTSVGSEADSPVPLLRPSPATGHAAEILDV